MIYNTTGFYIKVNRQILIINFNRQRSVGSSNAFAQLGNAGAREDGTAEGPAPRQGHPAGFRVRAYLAEGRAGGFESPQMLVTAARHREFGKDNA